MYIAYADMMAKVLHSQNASAKVYGVQQTFAGFTFCFVFQSCADGEEEEEDEEGKEKTFEVLLMSRKYYSAFYLVFESYSDAYYDVL